MFKMKYFQVQRLTFPWSIRTYWWKNSCTYAIFAEKKATKLRRVSNPKLLISITLKCTCNKTVSINRWRPPRLLVTSVARRATTLTDVTWVRMLFWEAHRITAVQSMAMIKIRIDHLLDPQCESINKRLFFYILHYFVFFYNILYKNFFLLTILLITVKVLNFFFDLNIFIYIKYFCLFYIIWKSNKILN